LVARGFDVVCGIVHADREGRDSLVYDLMDLFRPQVVNGHLNLPGAWSR
jgi:CRISPR/Cas system-associated endonuclease Cas1